MCRDVAENQPGLAHGGWDTHRTSYLHLSPPDPSTAVITQGHHSLFTLAHATWTGLGLGSDATINQRGNLGRGVGSTGILHSSPCRASRHARMAIVLHAMGAVQGWHGECSHVALPSL